MIRKKTYDCFFYFLITLFTLNQFLYAQDKTEEKLDKMILEEENKTSADSSTTKTKWILFGFFENENYFPADNQSKWKESNIIKLENRLKLNAKYGDSFFYSKASMDLYYYAQRSDLPQSQNEGRIEAQEIFIALGEKLQLKAGKQLFNWGSADAFNVTNYPDQNDLRELFAKDSDDQNRGVVAASLKLLFSNYSLELAILPLHSPALLPEKDSFWQIAVSAVPLSIPTGLAQPLPQYASAFIEPVIDSGNPLEPSVKNASFAARTGGTLGILDFHLSYFHGIDKSIIFRRTITLDYSDINQPQVSSVTLNPYYGKIDSGGIDLAFNLDRLSIRAEGSYTPNKWAMKETEFTKIIDGSLVHLVGTMETLPYFAYTVGMDINLWGEDGRLLIEWNQGLYLENSQDYEKEFLTDMLLVQLEDKFFDQRLTIELAGITRPVEKKFGYIPIINVTWDFQNGFYLKAGGMFFIGRDDPIIFPYDKNDYVYLKAKMDFS